MAERPSLLALQDYATKAARRMFPDQKGVDDQQDAARHMLAAGLLAQRFGPGVAKAAGVGHEVVASPLVMFRSLLGGKRPLSYDEDTHNNALGARLGAMTDSPAELENLVKMLAAQSVDINKQRRSEDQPWMGKSDDEAIERQTYGYAMGGVVTQPVQDEDNGFAAGGIVQYDPARVQAIVDSVRQNYAGGGAVHMAKGGRKPLPMPVEGGAAIDVANPQDESAAEFGSGFLSALPGAARRTVEGNLDLAGLLARYVLGAPSQKAAMLSKVPGAAEAVYEAAKTELPKIPARVASASPEDFGRLVAQYSTDTLLDPTRLGKTQTMTNIMKPKGGNWVRNAEKEFLKPLYPKGPTHRDEALMLGGQWAEQVDDPVTKAMMDRNAAITNWLDTKLGKYIKNEMGTPEDPVRALAEREILHYQPAELRGFNNDLVVKNMRQEANMPLEPTGKSELAKSWENISDLAVKPARPYRMQIPVVTDRESADNWLDKIGGRYAVENPDASAYSFVNSHIKTRDLGFDHIIDELDNAMHPNSGLPPQLQLKPEDLSKVSVPQAVQLVDKINKWREKQKFAANLETANNPATFVHKEYPEGYRWVELKSPVIASSEQAADAENYLQKALKYEGEQMGHCVGGYCPSVSSGETRIFSLRDKKGVPHVTIEVKPKTESYESVKRKVDALGDQLNLDENARMEMLINSGAIDEKGNILLPLDEVQDIRQIKGKANRKPADKYLPFVQDFVKGGNWDRVLDLENAGLQRVPENGTIQKLFKEYGKKPPKFMTVDEMEKYINWFTEGEKAGEPFPEGFARGGAVTTDYDPARVQSIIKNFQEVYNA